MSISCREVVEIVTAYLDGALPPADVARLERHLSGCDGCTEFIAQIRATTRVAAEVELDVRPDRDALLQVFRAFQSGH